MGNGLGNADIRAEPPSGDLAIPGVDAAEWAELTERGRMNGSVHAEEVALVLRDVELSGEVLDRAQRALHDAGIEVDETLDQDDDTLAAGQSVSSMAPARAPSMVPAGWHDEAIEASDERLLSRRRRSRPARPAARGDTSTS